MRCNGWYGRDRFWQSAPGDARSQEFVIDFGGERKVASVEIEWEVRCASDAWLRCDADSN